MKLTPDGSASRAAGLRRAGASSSANTRDVPVAGIEGFFEGRVDGVVAERGANVVVSDLSELLEER